MNFIDKYTTPSLILADKEGVEVKKISLTNDAYAIGQLLECLINKMVK